MFTRAEDGLFWRGIPEFREGGLATMNEWPDGGNTAAWKVGTRRFTGVEGCGTMRIVKLLFLGFLLAAPGAALGGESPGEHFAGRVRPLLEARCVSCHGAEKVKGGLRLDSREAVLKGGESGPAIVPGKPQESLLLQAVMHRKPDLEMPPKEKLTGADVAALERWIREGADWVEEADSSGTAGARAREGEVLGDAWSDRRNPIVRIFRGERLDLWSLKPVRAVEPPTVRTRRWARNPIDQFVLAKLEEAGLPPAAEASRHALCRRVYFDLTGLPPTAEEARRFAEDTRANAHELLVDDLLASPRYGEHQARLWLDVIRYSDSNGFDWDEFRPNVWRFRDYVIRAFNADKPFDQFIREQLAGDELVAGEPRTAAERDALVATGYLRLGPQDNSAGAFNEQDRARAEWMADLVETTGNAFLGLTMGCCRCHDHKYDPLSQADHYRMQAFFEPVKRRDDLALDLAEEQAAIRAHNAAIDQKREPLAEEARALLKAAEERVRAGRVAALADDKKAVLAIPAEKRTAAEKERAEAIEKEIAVSEKDAKKALNEDEKRREKSLNERIAALDKPETASSAPPRARRRSR